MAATAPHRTAAVALLTLLLRCSLADPNVTAVVAKAGKEALTAAVAAQKGEPEGGETPEALPPPSSLKHKATAVPTKKAPPAKATPTKASTPKPLPPPPPSAIALRLGNLFKGIKSFGVYSKYMATVEGTGFDQHLAKLSGYSLTFFIPPDSIMGQLKTQQPPIRLQLLKFMTLYGSYSKAQLDALKPGTKLVTTNNQMALYKLASGFYNGRATDKTGVKLLQPSVWYDADSKAGTWIVHSVSAIPSPASLDNKVKR